MGHVADVEQLSALHGLRELNLNHVAGIKQVRGMPALTQLRNLHIGYSDVDRVYLHQLSLNLPQLLGLDVAWSRVSRHLHPQRAAWMDILSRATCSAVLSVSYASQSPGAAL